MGEKSASEVVDIRVKDNEKIKIENIELTSIYTPGHTDCSYSFFTVSYTHLTLPTIYSV